MHTIWLCFQLSSAFSRFCYQHCTSLALSSMIFGDEGLSIIIKLISQKFIISGFPIIVVCVCVYLVSSMPANSICIMAYFLSCLMVYVVAVDWIYTLTIPESRHLHLAQTKKSSINWYIYTHESRLVLLASGMQCKTFTGY